MDRRAAFRTLAAGLTSVVGPSCAPSLRAAGPGTRAPATRSLLDGVFRAHGGLTTWQSIDRIDAKLSTGGLAFGMRDVAHRVLATQVSVYPHARRTILHDYPVDGATAVWEGDSATVRVEGKEPRRRAPARSHVAAGSRWDDLDVVYFVGYAIWNYLSFPFLLHDESISVRADGRWLDVQFPEGFPTHSRQQYFQLTEGGLLRRHDYVAEVFGAWASAANQIERSEDIDGLRFYTRRRVTPAVGRLACLSFPVLVWIHVDDIVVHKA